MTLWISDDMDKWWDGSGRYTYSNQVIELLLVFKALYRLPLRALTGFVASLPQVSQSVPDYTTLSRRAKKLNLKLHKKPKDITDIIIDSTGMKVYGEGEWKVRKHGWSYRRTWRKIHVGIDTDGEIRAVVVTNSSVHDAPYAEAVLAQETAHITHFYGDGAYDSNHVYRLLEDRGVSGYHIPPRENSCSTPASHTKRNEAILAVQELGRSVWKKQSGYHKRSRVETTMYQLKAIFGDRLAFRSESSQRNEIVLKCSILNKFQEL